MMSPLHLDPLQKWYVHIKPLEPMTVTLFRKSFFATVIKLRILR